MFPIYKNIYRMASKNCTIRSIPPIFIASNPCWMFDNKVEIIQNKTLPLFLRREYSQITNIHQNPLSSLEIKRYYSKKKGSKRNTEEDEESDSDVEYEETNVEDEMGDAIVTKNVPSLRLDSVVKVALGISKKKIEQDFYAFKFRCNGEKVTKKSMTLRIGDEVDRVRDFSPDTSKYLLVDRIIIKGMDKMSGTGMIPLKMEVLKQLTIENYEDPWNPSSLGDLEK